MVLMKKADVSDFCVTPYMYGGQDTIQTLLLIVALLCIPIMLFGKPVIIMRQQKAAHVLVSTPQKACSFR